MLRTSSIIIVHKFKLIVLLETLTLFPMTLFMLRFHMVRKLILSCVSGSPFSLLLCLEHSYVSVSPWLRIFCQCYLSLCVLLWFFWGCLSVFFLLIIMGCSLLRSYFLFIVLILALGSSLTSQGCARWDPRWAIFTSHSVNSSSGLALTFVELTWSWADVGSAGT